MNNIFNFNYIKKIYYLIKIDLINFKKELLDFFINYFIVIAANFFVMDNVLTYYGLRQGYGIFIHTGLLASLAIWELYPTIADITYDFDGNKKISYELILPIPTYFIFIKKILSFGIKIFIINMVLFPTAKIFMWNSFNLLDINIFKLSIFLFLISIFSGAFAVFATSIIKSGKYLANLWSRIIYPISIFGGYQFSWYSLNKVFPVFSYISFLNPMIYMTEGVRDLVIKDEKFISFEICSIVLIIFTIFYGYFGIKRLKKFLDFV